MKIYLPKLIQKNIFTKTSNETYTQKHTQRNIDKKYIDKKHIQRNVFRKTSTKIYTKKQLEKHI